MQKSLAILTSTFENAIVLTGDSILVKPLDDDFFTSEPFTTYGLINWQDFTKRYTSPLFYQVADHKVDTVRVRDGPFELPESRQVSSRKADQLFPLHDRKGTIPDNTSDGGLMVINKVKHWKTLLLATYYNLNGNACFYQLLTQSANSAEKETFAAAATVLDIPFYNVKTNVEANGFWYNNEYRGVGMLQFDPVVDNYAVQEFTDKYKDESPEFLTDANFKNFISESSEKKSAMFFRVNYPRLLPIELIDDKFIVKENGDRIRMFSDAKYFSTDLENSIWRVMNDYICHFELKCSYLKRHFKDERKSKVDREKFCGEGMKQHLLWLTGGR
ncbi:unnamed protein product [Ambrosiozyma monospora]|uniref:Unnamed protein product n=1 Tax=Ambrosiozyma monospora TaxID=43982 RepID=A0ACB5U9N9_AMBMO|nr:unnamed protein product [Ambrosiozyma monospora]